MGEDQKTNGKDAQSSGPAVVDEQTRLWQEYLQKCCEVGQILYQLEQLDGQKRALEKTLEVTQRAVTSAASKHREGQAKELAVQKASGLKKDVSPASETVQ